MVPPAAATAHDGLGAELSGLMRVIPGQGYRTEVLRAAAETDTARLKSYRAPAGLAESIGEYRKGLREFSSWIAIQKGTVSANDLIIQA